VPFGDVASVKDWLLIKGHVHKPSIEHPKRLVDGLSCSRKEISGSRFWGLIRSITGTPEKFFANCYVHNYCPLCFMTVSARNVTPPSLKCIEKLKLESVCDKALFDVVELLQVRIIVCIGKYVEKRCKTIFKEHSHLNIFSIIHPSPINPLSNKGNWIEIATKQLHDMNIIDIMKST
jgi:single-strand selective monofunctional uracil DNA glycosylase